MRLSDKAAQSHLAENTLLMSSQPQTRRGRNQDSTRTAFVVSNPPAVPKLTQGAATGQGMTPLSTEPQDPLWGGVSHSYPHHSL